MTVAPGGFRIGGVARHGPRRPWGEYCAAGAKRCPLRTRRAGRRLTDRCAALVQPGAGALRYVPASAARAPLAKQTRRAAAAATRNSPIGMAFSQVCVRKDIIANKIFSYNDVGGSPSQMTEAPDGEYDDSDSGQGSAAA